MILRPDAFVRPDGSLSGGSEICITEGRIGCIRPWTSAAREEAGCILSPAFVNAHSHLEYFDLAGRLDGLPYWEWLREITKLKPTRTFDQVLAGAVDAALQNVRTGVAAIGEVSDWPVSGKALAQAGLSGRMFQEVITFNEENGDAVKLADVAQRARRNAEESGLPVHLSAHAPFTVSREILHGLSSTGEPNSIHVSETDLENAFFQRGEGPIAEMYAANGIAFEPPGLTALAYLNSLDCLHDKTQLVHVCAFTDEDIELAAASGVSVAHCPRSNLALGCPCAPIARLRSKGVPAGLGMDSAASSGPVDMFAEMRAALHASSLLREPLTAQDVWSMATSEGARSLWLDVDWHIMEGASPALMLMRPKGRATLVEIIATGEPADVVRMLRV